MLHIYWIRSAEKPASSRTTLWLKELKKLSQAIEFYDVFEKDKERSVFFNPNELKKSQVVFLSEFSPSELDDVFKSLRNYFGPQRIPLPICFVSDAPPKESIDSLIALGFDEMIETTQSVSGVIARLKIRVHQNQNLFKIEKLVQEQTASNAKTETILNQREEFLSVCAHDLRSPLGLIQSSLSLVLNSSHDNLTELQKELIHRARRQSGDAINLVNDLLDVMSFEQGLKPQYQLFSLDGLLRTFYQDYQFQAQQKGIHFHYNNSLIDWRVLADSDRIRQLMQNLVVNAMKFTDRGKNIFLNVNRFQGRRKSDPPYPMLVVSIKDEGRGIPQKELQKIFDRFTQIKEHSRGDGRGLGLTVAKQISTLHDGNIWVESEEGLGSTFFVLFPHVISRTMASDLSTNNNQVRKILVVEPSLKKRESYFEILKRWGYEVFFGNDGVEAVTLSFHHMPQLVILSEGLSKMTESQVVDTLKSDPLTANIKALVAAESITKYDVQDYEFPFDGVLAVPFTQELLESAMRAIDLEPFVLSQKAA